MLLIVLLLPVVLVKPCCWSERGAQHRLDQLAAPRLVACPGPLFILDAVRKGVLLVGPLVCTATWCSP